MPQAVNQSSSIPPLPPGYTIDSGGSAPPLPAGYTLDAQTSPAVSTAEEPGFLDKEIPLSSHLNATLSGLQSIGRGVRDSVKGAVAAVTPQNDTEKAISAFGGPVAIPIYRTLGGLKQTGSQLTQVPQAIKDINQSPDPVGAYAKAGQETTGQGAGQALTALATEGLSRTLGAIKIPSKTRAGAALQDVKSTVGDVPINTAKVGDSALELYTQSQRGATLPPAVNKLIRRMTGPDSAPLTYAEAKDFQSNISSLSANEKMNLKPNQVRLVGQLNADLKASLADAADTAGKGEQFMNAMREYHQAMKLKGFTDEAIGNAWKLALKGAGVYGAAKLFGIATHDQ